MTDFLLPYQLDERDKRQRNREWASTVPIRLPRQLNMADVRARAERYYRAKRLLYRRRLSKSVSRGELIAFIRHNYTNYNALVREWRDRDGDQFEYETLRRRVNAAIVDYLDREKRGSR